jgi:hypothetical protein
MASAARASAVRAMAILVSLDILFSVNCKERNVSRRCWSQVRTWPEPLRIRAIESIREASRPPTAEKGKEQMEIDAQGHATGCRYHDPLAGNPGGGYADLFCDCHRWVEPQVLAEGSNIAWPAGWGEKQAEEWRRRNGLARPSEPGSGP